MMKKCKKLSIAFLGDNQSQNLFTEQLKHII